MGGGGEVDVQVARVAIRLLSILMTEEIEDGEVDQDRSLSVKMKGARCDVEEPNRALGD